MPWVEVAATAGITLLVSNICTCLWNHSGAHASYLFQFANYHDSLEEKTKVLQLLTSDVLTAFERDEVMGRPNEISGWLSSAQTRVQEANMIIREGNRQIALGCLGNCWPIHWWTCYTLGKTGKEKLGKVEELITMGQPYAGGGRSMPITVQVNLESQPKGFDALFEDVRVLIGRNKYKIMGLYGMGCVGKTMLLDSLNNTFGKTMLLEAGGSNRIENTRQEGDSDAIIPVAGGSNRIENTRQEGDSNAIIPVAADISGTGNTAHQEEADYAFHVVIRVVISRELRIDKVQEDIMRRLKLERRENHDEAQNAERISNFLSQKKFLLLLDDIWEPVNLGTIGIPSLDTHNSKVLFTTRLESVCHGMHSHKIFHVNVLDQQQAWILFEETVEHGRATLSSCLEIQVVARKIAEECGGLPSALITVGDAMASKGNLSEWEDYLNILRTNASDFPGMEEKVLSKLRVSYDSLQDSTVKIYFLYCSLYPGDNDINKNEIIDHWIGQGFLDEFENLDDARNRGHSIIGTLKGACLLENGSNKESGVKMHKVVRQMALSIGHSDILVRAGGVLVQTSQGSAREVDLGSWGNMQSICLRDRDIVKLPGAPECLRLETLLLQRNFRLSSISACFFQNMPILRVLDLSGTLVRDVPESIGGLLELRFLSLSSTLIRRLPGEFENLKKLRFLNLRSSTQFNLSSLPELSNFPNLQLLNLFSIDKSGVCHPSSQKLNPLRHLKELGLTIKDVPTVRQIGNSHKFITCLRWLHISRCQGSERLELALFKNMKQLREVVINYCLELEELALDCPQGKHNTGLLSTLEILRLYNLPKMNITYTEETASQFGYLSEVRFSSCAALKDLSCLVLAPVLKSLHVDGCKEMEEIFIARPELENENRFSKLERLTLHSLPKLKSISGVALPFPSLVEINVTSCRLLKKLPFTSNRTNERPLNIKGENEWWNNIEDKKSYFPHCFTAWRGPHL